MKKLVALTGAVSLLLATSAGAAINFQTFVQASDLATALNNNDPIGFTYAGDKFVGSVYFGTNNNQLYQTDLTGGNVQKFGATISGFSGEIYVSSSLGLGGFGSREVFAGSEASSNVVRVSHDGSAQNVFVSSGIVGSVRGIAFDPYGNYGNNMIVTTNAGNVYRVNSAGVATLLANVGGDAEGVDFTPQQFGNLPKGTLVVLSEGTGRLTAIDAAGNKTDLGLFFSTPEMLSFVPLTLGDSGNPLEGFYAANYPDNVVKAGADQFTAYKGDAILTEEGTHNVYRIFWDGSSFQKSLIGTYPNQPEDGIFVTSAILNPGCDVTGTCSTVPEPASLSLIGLIFAAFGLHRRARG